MLNTVTDNRIIVNKIPITKNLLLTIHFANIIANFIMINKITKTKVLTLQCIIVPPSLLVIISLLYSFPTNENAIKYAATPIANNIMYSK